MRALIVYEDSHRSYGEAMVGAVRASRPGLEEVALAHLRELEAELERFDPNLEADRQDPLRRIFDTTGYRHDIMRYRDFDH